MKIEYDGEGWPTLAFAGDGLDGADLDELAETHAFGRGHVPDAS